MSLAMTAAELDTFLAGEFPQVAEDFTLERVEESETVVRLHVAERHLRPGGTV